MGHNTFKMTTSNSTLSASAVKSYVLHVTETGATAARFLYQVIDESGAVVSSRRSGRAYVACTIDGSYYFGRVDLVGKGDHGRRGSSAPVAYLAK